jgi:hypothetical protein
MMMNIIGGRMERVDGRKESLEPLKLSKLSLSKQKT